MKSYKFLLITHEEHHRCYEMFDTPLKGYKKEENLCSPLYGYDFYIKGSMLRDFKNFKRVLVKR